MPIPSAAVSNDGRAHDCDVLVIGGGIAGRAAAYFASQLGLQVIVVDAGIDCASRVPTAMINPVRGYRGRASEADARGARFTLELIDRLKADGHRITSGRGVTRPIPDAATEAEWRASLSTSQPDPGGVLAHEWRGPEAVPNLLQGEWLGALYLPDAGWVETAGFLDALKQEATSGGRALWIDGQVTDVDENARHVTLADSRRITATHLVWCGGAFGAASDASSDVPSGAASRKAVGIAHRARFRPGTVLVTGERITSEALSYGLYCAPHGEGSVLGPSTEALFDSYPGEDLAPAARQALVERVLQTYTTQPTFTSYWRGVRLESAEFRPGLSVLSPFGSRGYLLAPRAGALWAEQLRRSR